MMNPAIQIEKLTKCYGRTVGIHDVDLQVNTGEIFGYLGPNGAGKTTTIRILMDFLRADGGIAKIFGKDCRRKAAELHGEMGYLPGDLALYPRLRVHELLRFFASLRSGVDWSYVEDLAKRFQCDLDRAVGDLSQGNKQKIGVLQAFMHRPQLLVLDEPTRGLDPLVRQEFYRLLSEAKDEGRTVFLSSHVLSEVEQICDRVGIIRDGHIVAVEDVTDLKNRSLREVDIVFKTEVPPGIFRDIPNVENVAVDGCRLSCRVVGQVDPIIKKIAGLEVVDITSRQPSLQEIFLTFYGVPDHAS